MSNKEKTAMHINQQEEKNISSNWRMLQFSVPIEQSVQEGKDFLIKGIAINSTVTRNGIEFISSELMSSAASLRNKPILKDHNNSIDSIVGRTTHNVSYNPINSNIEFEAKIMDESVKEKIRDGRIQSVSVGAMVGDLEESVNEQGKVTHLIAKGIDFLELSLVAVPADPDAGIAQAIQMSYDLKKQLVKSKMTEETKVEVKEEIKTESKKDFYLNEEVLKMMQTLSEQNKVLSEEIKKLKETKIEQKIETKVEEKVDETKGQVGEVKVEESTEENDYKLIREGRMFSFSTNSYPQKFKKLNRGKY